MPRYYFDIRDGDALIKDDEGTVLLDIADAQIEAAHLLADMTVELSMRAADLSGHAMSVEVRDTAGPAFSVGFAFSKEQI